MNTKTQTPKAPSKPWNFNTSPAARLAHYKALADFYADTYPRASNNAARNWRDKQNWNKPAILKNGRHACTYSPEKQLYFVDNLENCPFIYLGDADDHARLDHSGWYADSYQSELIKPAVVAFRDPHRLYGEYDNHGTPTHLIYLAATYRTESDGATIDPYHYETARDAARAADRMAEREAEESREYDAQYQAEQQTAEARDEIHEINREFLALAAEAKKARTNPYPGPVCAAVREKLAELLADRRAKFERIEKLKDNFWLSVPDC